MNPLVYFDFKEHEKDKDSVVITKSRLKEILDEVYQAGYNDGKYIPTITTTPWNLRDNAICINNNDDNGTLSKTIRNYDNLNVKR